MVGAGHIARSHAKCWQKEAIITAVCSRQQSSAMQLATEFNIPVVCADLTDLLRRDDVEAVGITTPYHLHFPVAIAAMQAEKHVFCEKPIALLVDEAKQMVQMAERSQVKTGIQAGLRQFKSLRHLRQLITKGTLGRIYNFHGVWSFDWAIDPLFPYTRRFNKAEAGTGALGDLGVYLIDAAIWLLGGITSVCADLKTIIPLRPIVYEKLHLEIFGRSIKKGPLTRLINRPSWKMMICAVL